MKHLRNISFLLSGFILVTQIVSAQDKKSAGVAVYSSSQEGDRLTRKADAHFTASSGQTGSAIVVNTGTIFQKMDGFGATFNEAGMICLNALTKQNRGKVFQALFDSVNGAGFTLMKSPIAACDFASAGAWYTYDEFKEDTLMQHFNIERDLATNGLIPFIREAKKYGKFEIESPMDFAPDWMYISLKAGEKHIQSRYYSALARYYSKYLQAYAASGAAISYLNLFNEADNNWYTNETYKEIGELIKGYVAPRLKADGLTTKIQFGETSNRPEALKKFPASLDDPEVRKQVHSLTVHGYDWDQFSTLTALHNKYPEFPIWQTEVCYALPNNIPPHRHRKMPVYGFKDGEFWGNMIINDMKNWTSAWIYWNMILDEKGGPWLVSLVHGNPISNSQHPVVIINRSTKKVTYTGLYYYLAHFSRFIRPGAYRIDCSGEATNLNFAGFKNADNSIVLNVINNGEAADCKIICHHKMIIHTLPAHSINTFKWMDGE